MYINRNIDWRIIVKFAWKMVLFYIFWSTTIVLLHIYLQKKCGFNLMIPFAPVGTIGVAVSFYLGFKNNQSYDRFWEARTAWGGLVNASRVFANQILQYVNDTEICKILIYRQLAYVNALRLQLRKPTSFSIHYEGTLRGFHFGSPERSNWDNDVKPFLATAEYDYLSGVQNMPTQILHQQSENLKKLFEEYKISEFHQIDVMASIRDLYNEQGRCERIKNTPFPRQYAYFSKVFTWIFVLLMPLALVNEFEKVGEQLTWLVVPFTTLISWIFMTIDIVGDNSEDPFENFMNDVPMTTLCRNIEIDLREMLGETELPPRILPKDGILM